MAKLSKKTYAVRPEYRLEQEIEKYIAAKGKGYSANQFFIEAATRYIHDENQAQMDSFYAPKINQVMMNHLKSFENRIAGLAAKNAIDSGMAMLMLVEILAKDRKVSAGEIFDEFKFLASRHVRHGKEDANSKK